MLVLSRKVGEKIQIGDNVTLIVTRIAGNRVTLGVSAPKNMRIVRTELKPLGVRRDLARDDSPRSEPVLSDLLVPAGNMTTQLGTVTVELSADSVAYMAPRRAR
ncbi:MAG: carbon storage regulator [Planctomycetia bacterium]|nr:carbon storage regulator [Planctomycetia bacterium]